MSDWAPPPPAVDDAMVVCMKGRRPGQLRNREGSRKDVPWPGNWRPNREDVADWKRPWNGVRGEEVGRPRNCCGRVPAGGRPRNGVRGGGVGRPRNCCGPLPAGVRGGRGGRLRPNLLSSKSNSNDSGSNGELFIFFSSQARANVVQCPGGLFNV